MTEKTVLIIDDSATIRRLVDNELSSAGYRVVLAGTAEEGMAKAASEQPDLILLDHQLPGTTGFEVSQQLLADEELCNCPVVVSSTLRKKAYVEYVDAPNVVDMLPKPYTSELLITTVQNALDTAVMVVQSQSQGSAVPETIEEQTAADLSGTCEHFGVRELIDLLNNGRKCGVLELETDQCRVWIYLEDGRIQAATAAGIDPAEVAAYMPESLSDMAPIVNFTVGGRRCSELDGLVELLDNKVLDSRLLSRMLRIQAAVLIRKCFLTRPHSFRFQADKKSPSLFVRLPLDSSLLALLVEGAICSDQSEAEPFDAETTFVRKAIRGQNLDRAGLSTAHLQLMGLLANAMPLEQIVARLGWSHEETLQVLQGFEMAELIERKSIHKTVQVIVVTDDAQRARQLHDFFVDREDQFTARIMNNWLAVGLMMKKNPPHVLIVAFDEDLSKATEQYAQFAKLRDDGVLSEETQAVAWSGDSENAQLFQDHDFKAILSELSDSSLATVLAGQADTDCVKTGPTGSQSPTNEAPVADASAQTPVMN